MSTEYHRLKKMNITLMNCSNECGNFETGEVIPLDVRISPILLMVALIHCCIVIVLGSLGELLLVMMQAHHHTTVVCDIDVVNHCYI